MLSLDAGTIHLWYAHQAHLDLPRPGPAASEGLSASERSKWQGLRESSYRHQFLFSRTLLRRTLSCYEDVAPGDWRFVEGHRGKPLIAPGQCRRPLFFNLSHGGGGLVIAVCRLSKLGVDLEYADTPRKVLKIAGRHFAGNEARDLLRLAQTERLSRFHELWTLKEAFAKAHGVPLRAALRDAAFAFPTADRLAVSFTGSLRQVDRAQWRFWQLQPEPSCKVALALGAGAEPVRTILSHRFLTLDEYRRVETRVLRIDDGQHRP